MIHIIQLLCPQRHAIFAVSYDPLEMPDDVALLTFQSTIEGWIKDQTINPWCGICGAKQGQWSYEQRSTKFKTMEEAMPELKKGEMNQMISRALIDAEKVRKN